MRDTAAHANTILEKNCRVAHFLLNFIAITVLKRRSIVVSSVDFSLHVAVVVVVLELPSK